MININIDSLLEGIKTMEGITIRRPRFNIFSGPDLAGKGHVVGRFTRHILSATEETAGR